MLAIIGGTGLDALMQLELTETLDVTNQFGSPSAPVQRGKFFGKEVLFLPRHGIKHEFLPHQINYRANLWALKQLNVTDIIAVAAVGGIRSDMAPSLIAVPDQLIDYTWGRESTFADSDVDVPKHVDFTYPYTPVLRQQLLAAAAAAGIEAIDGGTYGATQGPRLESPAEITRMERDGCALVGMTGMPETALARELDINYACCAVIANWAAGKTQGEITMAEIEANLNIGMDNLVKLLANL